MQIRTKISAGFLSIVFLMTIVAIIIIIQQSKMQNAFEDNCLTCELNIYLLECRRQEKNYICRNDDGALILYQANYDTLLTMTNNLQKKVNDNKIEKKLILLNEKLEDYKSAFGNFVQLSSEGANQTQLASATALTVAKARECETIIKDFRTLISNKFYSALSISSVINTFAVILGIFFSIMIGSFISDKILDYIDSIRGTKIV